MIPAPACDTTSAHDGSSRACGTYGTTSTFAGCGPSDAGSTPGPVVTTSRTAQPAQAGERRRQHARRLVEDGAEGEVDDGVAAGGEERGELVRQPLAGGGHDRTPGAAGARRAHWSAAAAGSDGGLIRRYVAHRTTAAPSRPGQLGDDRGHPSHTHRGSITPRPWMAWRAPSPRRRRRRPAPSPRGRRGPAPTPWRAARGRRPAGGRWSTKYSGDRAARPPDASCVQPIDQVVEAVGGDVGDELRPGGDDHVVTGVARAASDQREDRVDVAVHRAAGEEDPHRAMMRPAGRAVMETVWRSVGASGDRGVVARQLLGRRGLEHVDERQQRRRSITVHAGAGRWLRSSSRRHSSSTGTSR